MSNKFSYVMRSSSKSIPAENKNNCSMRLSGFLPSQYKYYDFKVAGFYIESNDLTFTTSIIELTVDGIDFVNGLDSKGERLKTLAFTT